MQERKATQHSPFPSLILNILIPVLILNKADRWLPGISPWMTLAFALVFPIGYSAYDLWTRKKIGLLPALGTLNVVGTGGLAALGLGGMWFAAKEAFFPLLIGVAMASSTLTRKPLGEAIFLNETLFNLSRINERLSSLGREAELHNSVRVATMWLAASFLLSAALNFGLAIAIFEPIAETVSSAERTQVLNQQIAKMTWMSFAVIAAPSFLITMAAFWKLVKSLRKMTELPDHELFRS